VSPKKAKKRENVHFSLGTPVNTEKKQWTLTKR